MAAAVVLVTGALTGIGRATALAFARDGAIVIASGRRDEAGAALAADLRVFDGRCEFVRADVRREEDVRGLIDGIVQRFGRLDVAVNNAGTEGAVAPLTEATPENYAAVFDTNVLGMLLCLKHQLRVMQPQGAGSIVNLSSTMGKSAMPGVALYAGSKHAVEGLGKVAALEAAPFNVRVNMLAPGLIETGMLDRITVSPDRKAAIAATVPMKRTGTVEEIADAILFLASDKARYITGQSLGVNGGRLM